RLEHRFTSLAYEILGSLLRLLGVALGGLGLRFDLLVRILPLALGLFRRGEPFPLHELLGLSLGLLDASLLLPLGVAVDLLHARTPTLGHFERVLGSLLRLLRGLDGLFLGRTGVLRSIVGALHPQLDRVFAERNDVLRGLAESTSLVSGLRHRTLSHRAHGSGRPAHLRNRPLGVRRQFGEAPP